MVESDGLLNRCTGANPYRGFESRPLRIERDTARKCCNDSYLRAVLILASPTCPGFVQVTRLFHRPAVLGRNSADLDPLKRAFQKGSAGLSCACLGCKRSQVQILSPRLSFVMSPSARTSKGFLIVGQRVAPSSWQFNRTISRIRRFVA